MGNEKGERAISRKEECMVSCALLDALVLLLSSMMMSCPCHGRRSLAVGRETRINVRNPGDNPAMP